MRFRKKKKRGLVALQLTALIDVFSMIIIFLIKGAVLGATSINVPKGLTLPNSLSRENLENAPKVFVYNGKVKVDFLQKEKKVQFFSDKNSSKASYEQLQVEIRQFLKNNEKKQKSNDKMLNLIADKETSYKSIYTVLNYFRGAGFQSTLFIVQSEAQ